MPKGFCETHDQRMQEADAGPAVVPMILARIIRSGRRPEDGCWACPLSDEEFQGILTQAALLIEQAKANGGSYTSDEIAIFIGKIGDD